MERYTRAVPQNPSWSKLPGTEKRTRHRCTPQQCQKCHSAQCGCESVLSVQSYVTKIRQTLDKKPPTCMILFRPGSSLTNPVSFMSEYNESPKDVQSSLSAHTCGQHCAKKTKLDLLGLEANSLNKGSQQSLDKMSYVSHKQEKGWHMSRNHVKWQKWQM